MKLIDHFTKVNCVLNLPGNPIKERWIDLRRVTAFGACNDEHLKTGGATQVEFLETFIVITENVEDFFDAFSKKDV